MRNPWHCWPLALLCAATAVRAETPPLPELDCVIEPHRVVEVSSPVGGVIRVIDVDKSDVIEKDQVLVELEHTLEAAEVESARARADMNSDIKTKKTNLGYALRKQERMVDLYKSGAVSNQEKDEADTAVRLAQLELLKTQESQLVAELELQKAIEALNLRTIKSPLSGVVVDRYKSAGEAVGEEPILKLAAINPLRVVVIAQAQHFGQIHKGMAAEVSPEHMADTRYAAQVSIVDRVVDAASGTFDVRLDLPNPDYLIPGGLKCKVRFIADAPAQVELETPLPAVETPTATNAVETPQP